MDTVQSIYRASIEMKKQNDKTKLLEETFFACLNI